MGRWPIVALGDVCSLAERKVIPVEGQIYRQLGVRLWGEGAYERLMIDGANTKYSYFKRIETDDLVVSKIWARNGSLAIATIDQSGTHVSTEFPTYTFDHTRVNPGWMRLLTKWRGLWAACDEKAQGTSGKNRIRPQEFLSISIPLPSLEKQKTIVARLNAVAEKVRQIETKLDEIEADAERLLAICFREAIEGAKSLTMSEVAPLVRREVEIDLEDSYPELGIRSFGKGTFHKPPLAGADVGTKRLYRIEPSDLLFSNVFAWEGAIAVVKAKDVGRYGSHRFIACVADPVKTSPEFLHYYFLSPEGLEKIGKASPGGAGRNRTLGLTKLMDLQIPIPSLTKQKAFDKLQSKVAAIKTKHQETRQELKALLPSMLEQIFTPSAKT